jgi:hypothetical protein
MSDRASSCRRRPIRNSPLACWSAARSREFTRTDRGPTMVFEHLITAHDVVLVCARNGIDYLNRIAERCPLRRGMIADSGVRRRARLQKPVRRRDGRPRERSTTLIGALVAASGPEQPRAPQVAGSEDHSFRYRPMCWPTPMLCVSDQDIRPNVRGTARVEYETRNHRDRPSIGLCAHRERA